MSVLPEVFLCIYKYVYMCVQMYYIYLYPHANYSTLFPLFLGLGFFHCSLITQHRIGTKGAGGS